MTTADRQSSRRVIIRSYACEDVKKLAEMKTEITPPKFNEMKYFLEAIKKIDLSFYNLVLF